MAQKTKESQRKIDISLFVFLALAIEICVESFRLGLGSFNIPQSGFFPFLIGLSLGILSLIKLMDNFFFSADREKLEISVVWQRIIPLLISLLVYAFLMPIIGFGLSTFLFVFFLIKQIESRGWWVAGLAAGGIASFCYLLFQIWLKVQLPTGWS